MIGWQIVGWSLIIAVAMIPPGLALALILVACRSAWRAAGEEEVTEDADA